MRDSAGLDGDHLIHHDRPVARIHDNPGHCFHRTNFKILDSAHESHPGTGSLWGNNLNQPPINRLRRPGPHFTVDHLDHALRGAEVGSSHFIMNKRTLPQRCRHLSLHRGTRNNSTRQKMVNHGFAPAGYCSSASNQEVALRLGINLAIGALQWGHHQGAAAQAFGIAH